MLVIYTLLCGAMGFAMLKLPGSFLPTEDQGEIMVQYTLPAGATTVRTAEVSRQVREWFLTKEKACDRITITGLCVSVTKKIPCCDSCHHTAML